MIRCGLWKKVCVCDYIKIDFVNFQRGCILCLTSYCSPRQDPSFAAFIYLVDFCPILSVVFLSCLWDCSHLYNPVQRTPQVDVPLFVRQCLPWPAVYHCATFSQYRIQRHPLQMQLGRSHREHRNVDLPWVLATWWLGLLWSESAVQSVAVVGECCTTGSSFRKYYYGLVLMTRFSETINSKSNYCDKNNVGKQWTPRLRCWIYFF